MCSLEHMSPRDLQDLLDELKASRASRKRAWEILQEIRFVLKDVAGLELPPAARKTIDFEGRVVKEGVRKSLQARQSIIEELIHAINEYRKASEQPLTLRGSEYSRAVHELNNIIDRAEGMLQ
jgi:hypothetical protein